MALVKKTVAAHSSSSADTSTRSSAAVNREAEAQRKRARTLAKQQQAAERIAAATAQMSSGIAEAASAAEELRRASDQIASGAETASGAAQESLSAFKQVDVAVVRQMQNANTSSARSEAAQALIAKPAPKLQAWLPMWVLQRSAKQPQWAWWLNSKSRRPTSATSSKPWLVLLTRPIFWP